MLVAFKEFQLADDLPIKIYKRRGSRSLRLSVTAKGDVRVSIPAWTSFANGLAFANSRLSWIQAQLPTEPTVLQNGQAIGKAHRLRFELRPGLPRPSARLKQTEIIISYAPELHHATDSAVQKLASRSAIRALRKEAEQLLPQRLQLLATKHGFTYGAVSIKQLKSRWGSCDTQQNIVLNLFLMQLPWQLIDYVLLHELVHTRVMQHGPKFWTEMESVRPDVKSDRREIRAYQPVLHAHAQLPVA